MRKLKNPLNKAKDTALDTHFENAPDEGRSYVIQVMDEEKTAEMLEDLMFQPPLAHP